MYKFLVLLIIIFISSNCSKVNNPFSFTDEELAEFQELAWDDLSDEEKLTVINTKDEFTISHSKLFYNNDIQYFKVDNIKYPYVRTNAALDIHKDHIFAIVEINTVNDQLLKPLFVLIHHDSMEVFGRSIRH